MGQKRACRNHALVSETHLAILPFPISFSSCQYSPGEWPQSGLCLSCRVGRIRGRGQWSVRGVCAEVGAPSPGSLGIRNLQSLGPRGVCWGPTGGHAQVTCPSSGSPENTDNAAPPGAWGASHVARAHSLVASRGHEARGASTGETAAPSGEGSRATVGREGPDPA